MVPRCVIVVLIVLLLCSALPQAKSGAPATAQPPTHAAAVPSVTPDVPPPSAFTTGMAASRVIGAPDFTTYWDTPNASAFQGSPEFASMDSHGDLWVPDFGANRVLEFLPPFTNGEAASLVIGQQTFTGDLGGISATNLSGPVAPTFDAKGDLWVTDFANSRILEYVPPFHNGMAASLVLGQSNFLGSEVGTSATNLSFPVGIAFDAFGDLWVTDRSNSRIVEFVPPFTTGMAASLAIGQPNLVTGTTGLSSTTLNNPQDVAISGNTLWVADTQNSRVLGYEAPFETGMAASIVLGQTSFTTNTATGEAAFAASSGVSVDAMGDLWVSDSGDARVLEFTPPFSNYQDPTVAIGQSSLTGTAAGDTATNLSFAYGQFFDSSGDLWLTDTGNNRVLEYVPSHFAVTVTPSGLPSGTPWTASVDGQSVTGTGSLHFSETNGTHTLVVTPVAGYKATPTVGEFQVIAGPATVTVTFSSTGPNPFSLGMAASIVLGQPNFVTAYPFETGTALDFAPGGLLSATFDASGDLWVSDSSFNRVLEFRPPFTNYMAASVVLGQSNFLGTASGVSATNLTLPTGLAFDASGDLWVADASNARILEFTPPFTTGMAASLVLGQTSFTTRTAGSGAAQLNGPFGLAFAHGDLWVADSLNNRILGYPAPFSDGEAATVVVGQSTLTGYEVGLTATNLSDASGLTFDSHGDMWVTDWANNRVLEFPAPITTGEAATVVLGQKNFTSNVPVGVNSITRPIGVAIDIHGDVWVGQNGNNVVDEFLGPATSIVTNQTPSIAVGQGSLTSYGANTTRTGLNQPSQVMFDPHGDLWVVDSDNNRVLSYDPTPFALNFTATGIPASTSWGVSVNGSVASGSGPSTVTTSQVNGTYDWSATEVPGWIATPSSGTAPVNGANLNVDIVYSPFNYTVTFTEKNLPAGTTWSVTVAGVTQSSSTATITFNEPNGTHAYTVGAVSGYSAANASGNVLVSAAPTSVTITFTSSPSGLSSTDLLLIIVVVVIVVAALAAVLLMRRKKSGPTSASPGGPPPGVAGSAPSGGPPPGAAGPPPPPS